MRRFPTIPAVLVFAAAVATGAAAQDTSTTTGTTEIQERAGIEATGEIIFHDIQITPGIQLAPVISSDASTSLTVTGEGAVVSVSVPATVGITLAGGEQSLTMITNTDGIQTGVTGLQSLVSVGDILSVDVSGEINVTPDDLAPGEYRGLLVVVAQYN